MKRKAHIATKIETVPPWRREHNHTMDEKGSAGGQNPSGTLAGIRYGTIVW